ncbi:uncharacterized protein LOC142170234 [Nicotiana tabacum]|uniref:Uncharacterized protein LOC142170234 n=1 Tax=Nicotiana tabacum TaxID=4097 RepID=A0AC58ST94_TOBAC
MVTVRPVIAMATSKHWYIYKMDVHNAFLQGDLFEEVYMQLPQGYTTKGESNSKQQGSSLVVVLVYVDDLLITGNGAQNASGLGLLISSEGSNNLVAYCDSDWAACPQSKKSVTGYLVKFGNSLVSWKSKKLNTVFKSSTEAEFRSMAYTVAELS